MTDLLRLDVLADDGHSRLTARVGIEDGGMRLQADGIYGIAETETLLVAVARAFELLESNPPPAAPGIKKRSGK